MIDLRLGDCLGVLRTLETASVDACVTDPPYGMDYQSARRTDRGQWKPKIANDKRPFIWWLYDAFRVTKDGGTLACFCEWKSQDVFRMAIETAGYTVRSQVIWDRVGHGMGDPSTTFAPQHDLIWFASKGRFVFSDGRPKSILRHQRLSGSALVHPNEKPVPLMRDILKAITPSGGSVLDPFAGSGTTGVAAAQLGLSFVGIEQSPEYHAIARRRIEAAQQVAA